MSVANFFANRRTIESITAPIGKIVEQLKAHADLHEAAANVHDLAVKEATSLAAFARREVTAAKSAAEKFAALLS